MQTIAGSHEMWRVLTDCPRQAIGVGGAPATPYDRALLINYTDRRQLLRNVRTNVVGRFHGGPSWRYAARKANPSRDYPMSRPENGTAPRTAAIKAEGQGRALVTPGAPPHPHGSVPTCQDTIQYKRSVPPGGVAAPSPSFLVTIGRCHGAAARNWHHLQPPKTTGEISPMPGKVRAATSI